MSELVRTPPHQIHNASHRLPRRAIQKQQIASVYPLRTRSNSSVSLTISANAPLLDLTISSKL